MGNWIDTGRPHGMSDREYREAMEGAALLGAASLLTRADALAVLEANFPETWAALRDAVRQHDAEQYGGDAL